MPKPEPNYAERAQNCEDKLASAENMLTELKKLDPATKQMQDRYERRLNAYEEQLRETEQALTVARTASVRYQEEAASWMRRANAAERGRVAAEDRLKQLHLLVRDKSCLIPQILEMVKDYV